MSRKYRHKNSPPGRHGQEGFDLSPFFMQVLHIYHLPDYRKQPRLVVTQLIKQFSHFSPVNISRPAVDITHTITFHILPDSLLKVFYRKVTDYIRQITNI